MTPQPLILALDTSTDVSTVSISRFLQESAEEVAGLRLPPGRTHTRSLLRFVERCLDEAGAALADVAAILVGTGPGTFTGVRIGVATARALALSLGRPVLGVSSLSAVAAAALLEGRVDAGTAAVVPLLDARRGQVFGSVYLAPESPGTGWRWTGEYFVSEPAAVLDHARRAVPEGDILVLGAAAGVESSGLEVPLEARHLLLGQERLAPYPSRPAGAGIWAWLADEFRAPQPWEGITPGTDGTPEAVLPVYVRAPDADIHIRKMKDPWA